MHIEALGDLGEAMIIDLVRNDLGRVAGVDSFTTPELLAMRPAPGVWHLVSQWEPRRRGIFCGTIGLASPVAGTELNVAIRTVEFDVEGSVVLGVAAASLPIRTSTTSGTSAYTRPHRSSHPRILGTPTLADSACIIASYY